MTATLKYIASAMLCVFAMQKAMAQESLDAELKKYESMCSVCLDLRARLEKGEHVSKEEARISIDLFVAINKRLKGMLPMMTVEQRLLFGDVGEWFKSGVRPIRAHPLQPVTSKIPQVLVVNGLSTEISHASCSEQYSYPQKRQTTCIPDVFVLAEVSADILAYGIRAGYLGRSAGVYVSCRSNFISGEHDYKCQSDGQLTNGAYIWASGVEKKSALSLYGGLSLRTFDWMAAYAGIGYGRRSLAWQDIEGNWVQVSDCSCRGFAAEVGTIFLCRGLAFSIGLSSILFKTTELTCGVGVRF